jgi:hypothetical protein
MANLRHVAIAASLLILWVIGGGAPIARAAEEKKPLEPPTPAIVKQVLEKSYREEWGKDWGNAKVERLTVDVSEPKIGESMERQLRRGEVAKPCYPARATVRIVVKYVGNDKPKEMVIGAGDGDAFLFYKNAFGEWTFKTATV